METLYLLNIFNTHGPENEGVGPLYLVTEQFTGSFDIQLVIFCS